MFKPLLTGKLHIISNTCNYNLKIVIVIVPVVGERIQNIEAPYIVEITTKLPPGINHNTIKI